MQVGSIDVYTDDDTAVTAAAAADRIVVTLGQRSGGWPHVRIVGHGGTLAASAANIVRLCNQILDAVEAAITDHQQGDPQP